MKYLVSYDLKTPGKDYEKLYTVLKSAEGWWHHLESTWILSTNQSLSSWSDKIRNAIDENDSFIIIDITSAANNGWLPQKAWDWLKNN